MATQSARGNVSSSPMSGLLWAAIALVAIGLAVMWMMPGGTMIGTVLIVGGVIAGVFAVLRSRRAPGDAHEEDTPLHLRD